MDTIHNAATYSAEARARVAAAREARTDETEAPDHDRATLARELGRGLITDPEHLERRAYALRLDYLTDRPHCSRAIQPVLAMLDAESRRGASGGAIPSALDMATARADAFARWMADGDRGSSWADTQGAIICDLAMREARAEVAELVLAEAAAKLAAGILAEDAADRTTELVAELVAELGRDYALPSDWADGVATMLRPGFGERAGVARLAELAAGWSLMVADAHLAAVVALRDAAVAAYRAGRR